MREKKKTRKKGADQQGKITAPKTSKKEVGEILFYPGMYSYYQYGVLRRVS